MPAEWEQHDATWIAWPHCEADWEDKFPAIDWVYGEIVRALAPSERVEILVEDQSALDRAKGCLEALRVAPKEYRFHILPTNRSWLRDSAPTAVYNGKKLEWIQWQFNAWAKYDNFLADREVPPLISRTSEIPLVSAFRHDTKAPLVLEGGAIDTDGLGTLLTTEECLLSPIQERNPELTRAGYEKAFLEHLGITKTIWLAGSCAGDDTHGHVDDAARFVSPGTVALAFESNPEDENYKVSNENFEILRDAKDALGNPINVVKLPMPKPLYFGDYRLPASYANFYIGNSVVIVPTFNDANDRIALNTIAELFPTRSIVGIASTDLVMGFGTLHCLSQQQPATVATSSK